MSGLELGILLTSVEWGLSGEDVLGSASCCDDAGAIENRSIRGSAQDCAEQLASLRDELGITQFIYMPEWQGVSHQQSLEQQDCVDSVVLPALAAR